MDQVSYSADISSIHLDDASQASDGFKQTGMQSVVAVEKSKGKKLNRFNRPKRTLPTGEKRKLENLFSSEQSGIQFDSYFSRGQTYSIKSKRGALRNNKNYSRGMSLQEIGVHVKHELNNDQN